MDMYHRVYVNRLNGSPIFYLGAGLNDCYGGAWTDFSLDEGNSILRLFTMVDHNLATEYDVNEKRQKMVDSWPVDIDDRAARSDWNWNPQHDLETGMKEYLIPNMKKIYS